MYLFNRLLKKPSFPLKPSPREQISSLYPEKFGEASNVVWLHVFILAAIYFAAGGILTTVLHFVAFQKVYPEFTNFMGREPKRWVAKGKDFTPISVKEFRIAEDVAIINGFVDGPTQ